MQKDIIMSELLRQSKERILDSWMRSEEMIWFMYKFNISSEEIAYNMSFIWWKFLDLLVWCIEEWWCNVSNKWWFFTTKFIDFMWIKKIQIYDFIDIMNSINISINLIKPLSLHKDVIDWMLINMDNFLLRNYLDVTLKILNEYEKVINFSWPVAKTNINWIITFVNDEFCNISWYSRDELMNKHFSFLPHPMWNDSIFDEINRTLDLKKNWTWNVKSVKKDWTVYWVKSAIIPIIDENNNVLEFIWVRTDITDLELTRLNLKESYDRLKELDRKKDEFLNIASHELRTPLTALKWYLSMIIDWDFWSVSSKTLPVLNQSYDNVLRLINIVNDMFDISRVEAWTMQFSFEKINIFDLLLRICEDMSIIAKQKNIAFISDISIDISNLFVSTDPEKLIQVIFNLITNAFKFVNDIDWKVILKSEMIDNKLSIKIIDNWIGIPKDKLDKIFTKFYQVDSYSQRREEWLWLWLTLSQNILKNLWSEIFVESEEWKGSIFYFNLDIID